MKRTRITALLILATIALAVFALPAAGSHAWGTYHWARTSNPFTIKLGDNVNSTWDPYLVMANNDWNSSTVLNTTIVPGAGLRRCGAVAGRGEVCNSTYGQNGWLGLAQIWLSNGHISQGTAKMNDTYFAMPAYNTPAERAHVMCQEVGHIFGLGHQDESGASLGTCMDYANDSTNSQHPNAHDYQMLQTIYSHLDSFNGWSSPISSALTDRDYSDQASWGRLTHTDYRESQYVRDFGGGVYLVTHVTWAGTTSK